MDAMVQLEIDDLYTMHRRHRHRHFFLETQRERERERDEEKCGRDGRAEKMQHTNVVTYFTLRFSKEWFWTEGQCG
jgi:hypothetical protein